MTSEISTVSATVRALIQRNLDTPALLDLIADDVDLVAAGVNSGEMIRVALACENYLGRQLSDTELSRMTSVREIATVLGTDLGA